MPELPEVETIKNELAPIAVGRTIMSIDILSPSALSNSTPEKLNAEAAGRRIINLSRRGKYLIFHLESGKLLVVHHKMTGSFQAIAGLPVPPRHTRAAIYLDNDTALYFIDPRRFGRFELTEPDAPMLAKLGPEPFSQEFTARYLSGVLVSRRVPIKPVLLNQELIAGIGNLYADEILFGARLSPLRPANSLAEEDIVCLHGEIRRILRDGIARGGASVSDYYRPGGEKGGAHLAFQVARRAGQPCPAGCGEKIERIFFRGRGTYYCPRCQK